MKGSGSGEVYGHSMCDNSIEHLNLVIVEKYIKRERATDRDGSEEFRRQVTGREFNGGEGVRALYVL